MSDFDGVTMNTTLGYVRALSSWGVMDKGNHLPALKAVALFRLGDEITAVATNRYSIVQHKTVCGADFIQSVLYDLDDDGSPILLPFAVLAQFVKAATGNKNTDTPVRIRVTKATIEIQMHEILVRGASIQGQYPRVDKLMDEKQPAKNGFTVFGLPLVELGYVSKYLAPNSTRKPVEYDYAVTFTDSSSSDKAGPLVLTTDVDKDFMVVIQPRLMNGNGWKGGKNG